ncbi:MAG TPA: hypothetical protein VEZ72_17160 [Paenibacillus sp.]|nr:hypothetical protein [Paenibacillus sp.]
MNLTAILSDLSQERPVFHNEADFQHALAWKIRERHPDAKVRLEMKVHGANTKVYLDILVQLEGRTYAIELKYKPRNLECVIDGEAFELLNQGAQDIGRYDVLKDVQRLETMVAEEIVNEGFLVFLTNDLSYSSEAKGGDDTVDRDFRLKEGRTLHGTLSWGERAGAGTTKGREAPIILTGHYDLKWVPYSRLSTGRGAEFQYLMLKVDTVQKEVHPQPAPIAIRERIPSAESDQGVIEHETRLTAGWFESFLADQPLPTSQADLTSLLTAHLRKLGYSVQNQRMLGKDKIDIWACKAEEEDITIEVRCKTALLQTIHKGRHIHLKHQGAQDLARYDFLQDVQKLERIADARPGTKGYAILITNDHLYWQLPVKRESVDRSFHLYDGRRLAAGSYAWGEEASKGTTAGREQPIRLQGEYALRWRLYLQIGARKHEQFQALFVAVPEDTRGRSDDRGNS